LARAKASESADFNLVAGLQSTGNAIKYDANDDVGFLPGHLNGLANIFGQIGPRHLARPRFITKESITILRGDPNTGLLRGAALAASRQRYLSRDIPESVCGVQECITRVL
jgi:hypothetical protein